MEHLQTFDESPLTLSIKVGNSVKLVGREWDVHDLTSIDTETGLPIAYADGQKTAAELVKRWNAYPELVGALRVAHGWMKAIPLSEAHEDMVRIQKAINEATEVTNTLNQ